MWNTIKNNARWVRNNNPTMFWSVVIYDIVISGLALVGVYHLISVL